MKSKKFLHAVANGQEDILQIFLDILDERHARYCAVGGLAVNAYVEPVVSLDLDVVVAEKDIETVCRLVSDKGMTVEKFEHSIDLSSYSSDLRIRLQTDIRYQAFISRAVQKEILGYTVKVACIEDVLQGKVWAYLDEQRRKSKRQKDLADIMRLIEAYAELESHLPQVVLERIES